MKDVIGLFGTAGSSKWRDPVIARCDELGIACFNPVVPDWTPELAEIEADHLATDKVILFVITGETESYGSLAETGWAALAAQRNGQQVYFVVEDFPDGDPKSAPNRARKLVRSHAAKAGVPIYGSVTEALEAAITGLRG